MCTLALFKKCTKSEYFHLFVWDNTHNTNRKKRKKKTLIRSKSCLSNRRMLCNSCFFVTQWSLRAWFLLSLNPFSAVMSLENEQWKCKIWNHSAFLSSFWLWHVIIIIIIKRISRAPIYHTKWQHRALYNNTNHTHFNLLLGGGRERERDTERERREREREDIHKKTHMWKGFNQNS